MVYKYKGINQNGSKATGRIEAPSLDDAKKRLKGQGILYEMVKESGENFFNRFQKLRTATLPIKILSNFSRNLSIYLKAGVPLIQAIRLLKTDVQNQKLGDFLTAIETMIEEGKSFHGALDAQKVVKLPHFYTQSIKVAEDNGLLDKVLIELSSFLKNQEAMTKQVKKALTYPMFIVLMAVIMVGVMLTVVVPKITAMFDQMKQELPSLTKFVVAAGDFISAYWLLLALIFTALA
ncbi:MAG: type II secretion system F family protein, partial [Thiovulaceae bacterium]|nr:type II secretion system F family protein [Sulfurimonadaceae bacterium]